MGPSLKEFCYSLSLFSSLCFFLLLRVIDVYGRNDIDEMKQTSNAHLERLQKRHAGKYDNEDDYTYATTVVKKRAKPAKPGKEFYYPYRPKFQAHPHFGMCRLEDFEFSENDRVGKGGYGTVFKARHIKTGKTVAVKYISANSIKEKPDHAELEETIHYMLADHPNVSRLFCTMRNSDNDIYLVTEFYDGGNLAKQISRLYPLPRPLLVKWTAQALMALRYIHSYCILYRDVKAENVMIDSTENIKLIDFGLAVYDCDNKRSNFAGTREYVAPEVAARKNYGRAADYYSFGILLYLMKTGSLPYRRGRDEDKDAFAERIARGIKIKKTGDSEVDDLVSIFTDLDQKVRWARVNGKFSQVIQGHPFFKGYDWDAIDEAILV